MVERLKNERAAEVEWRPFYLRPDTPEEGMELPAAARGGMGAAQERLKQMAQAAGLPMVFPTRLPNTRRAHEATEHARAHGRHEEFHRVVFRQFYGEGRDISRWEILRAAAREVGLTATSATAGSSEDGGKTFHFRLIHSITSYRDSTATWE